MSNQERSKELYETPIVEVCGAITFLCGMLLSLIIEPLYISILFMTMGLGLAIYGWRSRTNLIKAIKEIEK